MLQCCLTKPLPETNGLLLESYIHFIEQLSYLTLMKNLVMLVPRFCLFILKQKKTGLRQPKLELLLPHSFSLRLFVFYFLSLFLVPSVSSIFFNVKKKSGCLFAVHEVFWYLISVCVLCFFCHMFLACWSPATCHASCDKLWFPGKNLFLLKITRNYFCV